MTAMHKLLEKGPVLRESPKVPQTDTEVLNRLAFLVGCVAVGLPVVLIIGATIGGSCFRHSISHFYYAQFLGPIFVGMLFFIGGFLLAYSGDHPLEDRGSTIAGIGAFVVACFPTKDNGCALDTFLARVFVQVTNSDPITVAEAPDQEFFNLFNTVSDWHTLAAAIVFIYLGLFCLIVMKRILPERHIRNGKLIEPKRKRNRLYSYCGIVILLCVAVLALKGWLGSADFLRWWNGYNLTFAFETTALWAFGLAWFIKGRVFEHLNDA